MNRLSILVTLPFMIALMLLTESVVCSVELSDVESIDSATIDIRATGTARVQFTSGQGPNIEVNAQGSGDTHFNFTSTAGTIFEIAIDGDGAADIEVSGPSELKVIVEGPSKVRIAAGDEVAVNVQGDDESQVFLNEQVIDFQSEGQDKELLDLNDPEDEEVVEDNLEQVKPEIDQGVQASNTNLKIMAGTVPALAIAAFFFSRKKYNS